MQLTDGERSMLDAGKDTVEIRMAGPRAAP
jgi:hypothetical protein